MAGGQASGDTLGYLPQALLATGVMLGAPIGLVLALTSSGVVSSVPLLIVIAVALSFLISRAGAAIWQRRPGGGELLFGELMLWGWLQRLRSERRLAEAVGAVAAGDRGGSLPPAARAERLRALSAALEASDPYTHGHSRRVARHSATIATRLRLSDEQVAKIRTAAAVHDVGKVNTPAAVLRKDGRLTDEEFAVVKRHSADGAKMVVTLEDPELTRSVLHHHERLDGTGYPAGLSGEEIPIGARIIAVADTFDAITSTRPYRRARTHREALAVLAADSGSRLDPTAVRAFVGHYSDSRPLALWTALISGPERLVGALGGSVNAASTAVASIVVAAVTALGPGIGGDGEEVSPSLAAGSADPAAIAPPASSSRGRSDSPRSGKRGGSSKRSKPDRSKPAPQPPTAAVTDAGPPPPAGVPAAAQGPVGAPSPASPVKAPEPAIESPPDGESPAPAPPPSGGTGQEPPGSELHLLPHLPLVPHPPHVPGFED